MIRHLGTCRERLSHDKYLRKACTTEFFAGLSLLLGAHWPHLYAVNIGIAFHAHTVRQFTGQSLLELLCSFGTP